MKRLISFSLYGDKPVYFRGAIRNIEMREQFYPDWTRRFYVSREVPQDLTDRLKSAGAEVIVMDDGGANPVPPMCWRFLAAGEEGVERCLVRDADARPSAREVRMVDEWLASGKAFHIIRDHPLHTVPITGGLWGCAGNAVPWMRALIRNEAPKYGAGYAADQRFLSEHVYPKIKDDVLIHSRFVRYRGETVVAPPPWKEPRVHAAGALLEHDTSLIWKRFQAPRVLVTSPLPLRKNSFLAVAKALLSDRLKRRLLRIRERMLLTFFSAAPPEPTVKTGEGQSCAQGMSKGQTKVPPAEEAAANPTETLSRSRSGGKKLIAFSLFGLPPGRFMDAVRNAEMREEFYPDWTRRFYAPPGIPDHLIRRLRAGGAEVVVMDGALAHGAPACRHFSAAADPGVDICLIRNVRSRPCEREVRMVNGWLASGKAFHIIRDAPSQNWPIPAGTWGVRGGDVIPRLQDLLRDKSAQYETAEWFLWREIYPLIRDDAMIHSGEIQFPGENVVAPPPWEEPPADFAGKRFGIPEIFYLGWGETLTPKEVPFPPQTGGLVSA